MPSAPAGARQVKSKVSPLLRKFPMKRSGAGLEETALFISVVPSDEALASGDALSLAAGEAIADSVAAGFALSVVDDDFDHTIKPSKTIAKVNTTKTWLELFFLGAEVGAGFAAGLAGVLETLTLDAPREFPSGTGGTVMEAERAAAFFVRLGAAAFFTTFLVAAFFTDFLATFLAADFLTFDADFFAVDFFAADFFAAAFFTATDDSLIEG